MILRYEKLIETLSEIVENENIYKEGLTLHYEIIEEDYKKVDEHLFYKINNVQEGFMPSDTIEIEIAGIKVKITPIIK